MSPEWRIVFDELDQMDTSARIFQLARKDYETIVVYPGPDGGKAALARETLIALGKNSDRLTQSAQKLVAALPEWIRAEQVKDIIIYGAERIRGRHDLFDGVSCRIWAVTGSRRSATTLTKRFGESRSLDEMFASITVDESVTDIAESEPFPRVPYDEFFTFTASSRELHGPGPALDLIVKAFYEAYRGANGLLRVNDPPDFEIKSHVHTQVSRAPCVRSAVCRLRGIQASLFDQWCYLRVDLLPFLALWNVDSKKGRTGEIAQECRAGIDSLPGVVASIAHLSELTARAACGLVSDYASDGSSFTLRSQEVSIPPELQAFFRHQYAKEDPIKLFPQFDDKYQFPSTKLRKILNDIELKPEVRFAHEGRRDDFVPQMHHHLEVHQIRRFPLSEEPLAAL